MGTKNSFVYYNDWAEGLLELPDELRLKIDDAVKRYVLYGEEPTDREIIYSMFGLMRKQIDKDSDKWNEVRNKRSEAGKKGAEATHRQKSANVGKCHQVPADVSKSRQKSANSAVNVNVNVSSNEDIKKEICIKKKSATTEPISEEEQKFLDGMQEHYPSVCKMKAPLTFQQYQKLQNEYTTEAIRDILERMENYAQLHKKCTSANLTIRNWIKNQNR